MNEVYVIEKIVVVGIWELATDKFYTDEKEALNECENLTAAMQKYDQSFRARVKKLTNIQKSE